LTAERFRLCLLLLLSAFVLWGCAEPPTLALNEAQSALKAAARVGAIKHAESQYREGEKLLQRGWMEMAHQQGRLPFLRKYTLADSLLRRSCTLSRDAAQKAQNRIGGFKNQAIADSKELEEELGNWREALDNSFVLFKAEHYWNMAEMGLQTSKKLIWQGEYESAIEEVAQSHFALSKVSAILNSLENDEAGKIKVWKQWVEETIAESRRRGICSVVADKSAHKLFLYKSGKLIKSYNCDLGYNSSQQKMFSGDGATPEGKYTVTKVKPGNSKYYKALLLNYPNAADASRFKENKRKGLVSRRAGIGGLIEIHGNGGQGKDWTNGCIAITNEEMDQLMKYAGAGTPVTIVRKYNGNK